MNLKLNHFRALRSFVPIHVKKKVASGQIKELVRPFGGLQGITTTRFKKASIRKHTLKQKPFRLNRSTFSESV